MRAVCRRLADHMQRLAARSPLAVRLAIAVRNQARCVIKYHLAESPDVNETGEVWLRAVVAGKASRIVDVGANVGDWLAGMLAVKGDDDVRALAFEPSASAFARLSERFGKDPRIVLQHAAVGDCETRSSFAEEANAGRGSTLVPGFGSTFASTRTVAVTTLDRALAEWNGADFVKIDAEGYDARVILGARDLLDACAIGVLQFEYNRAWQMAGSTLYGTYRFLEARGYRVFLLKRSGLYELDYERYEEYYEYSNFVALAPAWYDLLRPHLRGKI